jgi:GNAT superfamily N-acetyltransferase
VKPARSSRVADADVLFVGERSGLVYAAIRPEWAAEIAALDMAAYPTTNPRDLYDEAAVLVLTTEYPQGSFAAFDGDELVAMGLGVRTDFDFDHPHHTIHDIVPVDASSSGYRPTGLWYYGTSIVTRPEYRRRGIGAELYELRKGVCRASNLMGIVAGGVIPGYADHKHALGVDAYLAEVQAGRLYDATLSFQLANGFEVRCPLPGYLNDESVDGYAALIVWPNSDYQPEPGRCVPP